MMDKDIIRLKRDLSDHELSVLNSEMEKHKKSTAIAYVLWFLFGTLGIHKFYIGKIKAGVLYFILGIIGWICLLSGIILAGATIGPKQEITEAGFAGIGAGLFILVVCGIILTILLLIDLFTIPGQIRKTYEKAERKIVARIKGVAV